MRRKFNANVCRYIKEFVSTIVMSIDIARVHTYENICPAFSGILAGRQINIEWSSEIQESEILDFTIRYAIKWEHCVFSIEKRKKIGKRGKEIVFQAICRNIHAYIYRFFASIPKKARCIRNVSFLERIYRCNPYKSNDW